jgi:HK97 family phage prohead protease
MTDVQLPAGMEWAERAGGDVAGVSYPKRIVTLVAVPYDTDADIREDDGSEFTERFARGSFDGIQPRTGHIHANRDHDRTRPVGKVDKLYPSRREGLVADIKVSRTELGEETLALADDGVLHSSIKFGAYPADIEYSERGRRRTIKRAFLDHIAFVTEPAYATANVLSVRSAGLHRPAATSSTPLLDEVMAQWADEELRSRFNL